jgi:hypothetical protein
LARLRKNKEYIDKKSSAQSVALEAELDREEAEEAALWGAIGDSAFDLIGAGSGDLPEGSSAGVLGADFDSFLGLRQGGLSPGAVADFDFGSPLTT